MAANLIEALEAWIGEQPAITGLFPVEIYNDDAPPGGGVQLPALTFTQKSGKILGLIGGGIIQWPEVNIEVQAAYAEDARRLAGRVRDILLQGSPLSWQGGSEAGRYETDGEGGELEQGIGPDGGDVWVHRIPLVFITARD
jgi:hypothetical protein